MFEPRNSCWWKVGVERGQGWLKEARKAVCDRTGLCTFVQNLFLLDSTILHFHSDPRNNPPLSPLPLFHPMQPRTIRLNLVRYSRGTAQRVETR